MSKKNKANKEKLSATYNYTDSKNSKDSKEPSYSDCKDNNYKNVKDSENSTKNFK